MPTPEQIESAKRLLEQKIDSPEKWAEVRSALRDLDCREHNDSAKYMAYHCVPELSFGGAHWWVDRQLTRMRWLYEDPGATIYDRLAAMGAGHYLPHPSREDPTMVAYTPSTDDGLRDKTIRSTVGRFLRKVCILLTDAAIQGFEQEWRACVDPTFHVARTPEEIVYVYTRMAGDTGCMRYSASNWRGNKGHHPSEVYAAPGLGVAYLGEMNGAIVARAVIYDNPSDPSDKRYVRIYGAPQLRTKLERAGYRCAALNGVELKAIPLGDDSFVLPYVDPAGGNRNSNDCIYVIRTTDKPDVLRLLSGDETDALSGRRGVNLHLAYARHTEGNCVIPLTDLSALSFTCHLSGRTFGPFDGATPATLLTPEGEKTVAQSAITGVHIALLRRVGIRLYVAPEHAEELTVPVEGTALRAARSHLDALVEERVLTHLSEAVYGADQYTTRSTTTDAITGETVKHADTVVFCKGGGVYRTHRSNIDASRDGPHVRLNNYEGEPAYAAAADEYVTTTNTGRRVYRGVHEVVPLLNGGYAFLRSVYTVRLMGRNVHIPRATHITDDMVDDEFLEASIERLVHDRYDREEQARTLKNIIRRAEFAANGLATVAPGGDDSHLIFEGNFRYDGHSYEAAVRTFTRGADRVDALLAAGQEVGGTYVAAAKLFRRVHAIVERKLAELAAADAAAAAEAEAAPAAPDLLADQLASIRRDLERSLAVA